MVVIRLSPKVFGVDSRGLVEGLLSRGGLLGGGRANQAST